MPTQKREFVTPNAEPWFADAMVEHDDARTIATTIRVPRRVWIALRSLAEAADRPGRPTVSGVVTDLVDAEMARNQPGASKRA